MMFLFYFLFVVSHFSAGHSRNGVHSLASSFILIFSPALFFIQQKYFFFQLLWQGSITLLCHLHKTLLYVHDIKSVQIGSGGYSCMFFPPHQTKVQGYKKPKNKSSCDHAHVEGLTVFPSLVKPLLIAYKAPYTRALSRCLVVWFYQLSNTLF